MRGRRREKHIERKTTAGSKMLMDRFNLNVSSICVGLKSENVPTGLKHKEVKWCNRTLAQHDPSFYGRIQEVAVRRTISSVIYLIESPFEWFYAPLKRSRPTASQTSNSFYAYQLSIPFSVSSINERQSNTSQSTVQLCSSTRPIGFCRFSHGKWP